MDRKRLRWNTDVWEQIARVSYYYYVGTTILRRIDPLWDHAHYKINPLLNEVEQTVTAKGREGTQMLLTIFDAFDDAGVVLPDPPTEEPADS